MKVLININNEQDLFTMFASNIVQTMQSYGMSVSCLLINKSNNQELVDMLNSKGLDLEFIQYERSFRNKVLFRVISVCNLIKYYANSDKDDTTYIKSKINYVNGIGKMFTLRLFYVKKFLSKIVGQRLTKKISDILIDS